MSKTRIDYLRDARKKLKNIPGTEEVQESLTQSIAVFRRMEEEFKQTRIKCNALEAECLRLKELKDAYYDLQELMGIESYKKQDTNDSMVTAGKTKVIVPNLGDPNNYAEILIVTTMQNVGYGIILGGKNIDNIHGMLVKFPLDMSFVKRSILEKIKYKLHI